MQFYELDSAQVDRIRSTLVRYNQISSNLISLDLEDITQLDYLASASMSSTLRELIMDIRVEDNENFAVIISTSLNGNLEMWEKKNRKKI